MEDHIRGLGSVVVHTAWSLVTVALLVWVPACSSPDHAAVEGWPRPAGTVLGRSAEPEQAIEPWVGEPPPALRALEVDEVPERRPRALPRLSERGCGDLVDRACEFLGLHSEECMEVRTQLSERASLASQPVIRQRCSDLLDAFDVNQTRRRRASPCGRLSRMVCREMGHQTRACSDALDRITRFRKEEQRRACEGDLLLWEFRSILMTHSPRIRGTSP